MADKKAKKSGEAPRSVTAIEADLTATRDRLSRTVDELAFRASPAEIKRKQTEKLKGKVHETVYDEDGAPRLDLLATALGVVAGVAITLGLARRIFYRG